MIDFTQGPARTRLDQAQADALRATGALIVDERRRRSRFFDGRFLAARDLTREQVAYLVRQADLNQAIGARVVHGLSVRGDGDTLVIARGHGVTPTGESVSLTRELRIPLARVPELERLDLAFGLTERPRDPGRNRTGLFVVALRAVEFTANPIAAYPTTVDGSRKLEDGDIVEATAVTLIPFVDEGPQADWEMRRARAAFDLFVRRAGGTAPGVPAGALPLAMIALDKGILQWADVDLVRRESAAEADDDPLRLSLGGADATPGLRRAFVRQYDRHLEDVLALFPGQAARLSAADHFFALPPVGRMPSAAIDPDEFTQVFFPPTVEVRLSVVPEDELPTLIEEGLDLPPIDLTRGDEALENTTILALLPLPRAEARTLLTAGEAPSLPLRLRPVAAALIARRTPLELLRALSRPAPAPPDLPAPVEAPLKAALVARDRLWYVRMRRLAAPAPVRAVPIP